MILIRKDSNFIINKHCKLSRKNKNKKRKRNNNKNKKIKSFKKI